MKKIIPLFYLFALIFSSLSAFAQKYTKVEDTTKLNKEYVNLSNEIAELKGKLIIAQNNLPGYQSKAKEANSDAAHAASASSDQASKATNGSVKAAKSAKRKANKSYNQAQDSRSADKKVDNQEDKIAHYTQEIQKKEQRRAELDVMRLAIFAKILPAPVSQIP